MSARLPNALVPVLLGGLLAVVIGFISARSPVLALAGAGAVLLLACVFLRAEALLVLLVAAFPWDDALAYPTATISVIKILGMLVLLGYAFRALGRSEPMRLPSTLLPVLVFLMLVLVSLLFSEHPDEGIAKALRYTLFTGFFFLFAQLVRTLSMLDWCLRALTLSAALASVLALVSFLQGKIGRAAGPIGEANDFAYLLASLLPFVGYLIASDRHRRTLWVSCFVLLTAALFATLSRGALMGIGALAVWGVATRRVPARGLFAGGLAVVGVLLVAFSLWRPVIDERLQLKDKVAAANVASRQALWSAAARMTGDHPFIGVGPGAFGPRSADYLINDPVGIKNPAAHNSYLEIMAESGVVAVVAFLLFLAGTWRLLNLAYRESTTRQETAGAQLAVAAQASLVVAAVSANFLSVELTIPLWLVGGVAVALAGQWGAREAQPAAPARRPLAALAG